MKKILGIVALVAAFAAAPAEAQAPTLEDRVVTLETEVIELKQELDTTEQKLHDLRREVHSITRDYFEWVDNIRMLNRCWRDGIAVRIGPNQQLRLSNAERAHVFLPTWRKMCLSYGADPAPQAGR